MCGIRVLGGAARPTCGAAMARGHLSAARVEVSLTTPVPERPDLRDAERRPRTARRRRSTPARRRGASDVRRGDAARVRPPAAARFDDARARATGPSRRGATAAAATGLFDAGSEAPRVRRAARDGT